MTSYQEIEKLKRYFLNHQIKIFEEIVKVRHDLFFADVVVDGFKFKILIDDEFDDFEKHNTLFKWFLVLNALEVYKESEDIIEWSKEMNVLTDRYLDYYKDFNATFTKIIELLGEVDPCISSFDYTLRTGVIRALEKAENS